MYVSLEICTTSSWLRFSHLDRWNKTTTTKKDIKCLSSWRLYISFSLLKMFVYLKRETKGVNSCLKHLITKKNPTHKPQKSSVLRSNTSWLELHWECAPILLTIKTTACSSGVDLPQGCNCGSWDFISLVYLILKSNQGKRHWRHKAL